MKHIQLFLYISVTILLYSCAPCPKCPKIDHTIYITRNECKSHIQKNKSSTISILSQHLNKNKFIYGDKFFLELNCIIKDEYSIATLWNYRLYFVNIRTKKRILIKQESFRITKSEFTLTIKSIIPKHFRRGTYIADMQIDLVTDSSSMKSKEFTIN